MKQLTPKLIDLVEDEVRMLLHASRDCLRNRRNNNPSGYDPKLIRFDCNDAYYSEAFGIMRALRLMDYGTFKAVNTPKERWNLKWWFARLEDEVLQTENWGGSGKCHYCIEKYGKDDSTCS